MDNLKRKNQISDSDLKSFKEQEINKILIKANDSKPKRFNLNFKVAMTFSVVLIALVSLSFILFNNPEDELKNFNLQTFSNNSYLLEADNDEFNLKFYYFANVVREGGRTVYNEKYDYYLPYEYVSQDIVDQYDVDFRAFEYEGNRFFLEVIVNGESSYLQVNFATDYETTWELTDLELDNFKEDIEEIFNWIEMYPPELLGYGQSKPVYQVNSEVNALEDSKAKRNYITYVTNFYIPNNPDYEENPKDYLTVSANHVILVDDNNDFIESHFDKIWCIGTCTIDNIQTIFTDLNSHFSFLLKDSPDNQFLPGCGWPMDRMTNTEVSGVIRSIDFGDPYIDPDSYYTDIYLLFEYIEGIDDFNDVNSATVSIEFTDTFGGLTETQDIDVFAYNNALITEPFFATDIADLEGLQIYNFITIALKDVDGNILKTITFDYSTMYEQN